MRYKQFVLLHMLLHELPSICFTIGGSMQVLLNEGQFWDLWAVDHSPYYIVFLLSIE